MLGEVDKENDGAPVRGSGNGNEKPRVLSAWCHEARGGMGRRQAKPLQLLLRSMDYGNVFGFDE